ncbi:serine/threonine protein kinase, partial [Natronoarchaeum mannanilyticum]
VGRHLAALHGAGLVHGDPTTRNVRVDLEGGAEGRPDRPSGDADRVYLIDFGLGFYTDAVEDYAMDLHVFAQSLDGTAEDPAAMRAAVEDGYADVGDDAVIEQLREIESRGRYQ